MSKNRRKGKRRGLRFVVKVVLIGVAVLAAVAIAGDDELRASLASRVKGLLEHRE